MVNLDAGGGAAVGAGVAVAGERVLPGAPPPAGAVDDAVRLGLQRRAASESLAAAAQAACLLHAAAAGAHVAERQLAPKPLAQLTAVVLHALRLHGLFVGAFPVTKSAVELMRVDEVARVLQQHPGTVYRKFAAGQLPAVRLGAGRSAIRVSKAELERWLVSRRTDRNGERR